MNRIIIIGNGFDLAHNLPTSYRHYVDHFWTKKFETISSANGKYDGEFIYLESIPQSWLPGNNYETIIKTLTYHKIKLDFKNQFLKHITNKNHIQNWVDIENEYYECLKSIINKSSYSEYDDILKLNNDFEKIKHDFENYLKNNVINNIVTKNSNIDNNIYECFDFNDFTEPFINRFSQEVPKKIKNNEIKASDRIKTIMSINNQEHIKTILLGKNTLEIYPDSILFLNFNYTDTQKLYMDNKYDIDSTKIINNISLNHIHGNLSTTKTNPIIFGYGDEIDNEYQNIERQNNNSYLEYIKSFKYLETDNYKKLLQYINAKDYQIFLFGHSCGTSDRTLLNTLFEHKNCVSIKPFYYKNSEGDNYQDIIKNISRSFNSKTSMRDKVVNKKFCKTLT